MSQTPAAIATAFSLPPELCSVAAGDDGYEPWNGVRFVAYNASTHPTHGVDITGFVEAGVESLLCHEVYLANLDADPAEIPGQFLRDWAVGAGASIGAEAAVTFELLTP